MITSVSRVRRAECLDTYWQEILFFLIGEHADIHAHQVMPLIPNCIHSCHFQMNGAVVNVRGKGDKVAVWLADSSLPDSVLRSRQTFVTWGLHPEVQDREDGEGAAGDS